MDIGWIRQAKRLTAARQIEDLLAAGVDKNHLNSDWNEAWQDMRGEDGDVLVVASLHLLAPDEVTLKARLADIEKRGCMIRDLETGLTHHPGSVAASLEVKRRWQIEKTCQDKKEMSRRGKLGGAPKKIPEGSAAEKLVKAMVNMDKTNAEIRDALAKHHGIIVKDAKTIAEVVLREDKPPARRRGK